MQSQSRRAISVDNIRDDNHESNTFWLKCLKIRSLAVPQSLTESQGMNKAVIGHGRSCMVSQSRRSGLISGTKALPHGITVGTEELMQGRSILRIAINTKDARTYVP